MKFEIETQSHSIFTDAEAKPDEEIYTGIEVERIEEGDNNPEIKIEFPQVGFAYLEPKQARQMGRLLIALSEKSSEDIQFV